MVKGLLGSEFLKMSAIVLVSLVSSGSSWRVLLPVTRRQITLLVAFAKKHWRK